MSGTHHFSSTMLLFANGWRLPQITGTLISMLLHLMILWSLLVRLPDTVMSSAPAIVMLEFAHEIQVAQITEAPPGVNQQRRVEEAMEQTTKETRTKTPEQTRLNEDNPPVTEAEQGELRARQKMRQSSTTSKPQHKKKAQTPQQAVAGNSTITSRANPPAQDVVSDRTTAPAESDTNDLTQHLLSWEALVKAKINRVKMYPADAERRGRTGYVLVSFTVNAQGVVTASNLQRASGTISLDRAALAAVKNAQPLPAPPAELLSDGVHKVTMPVNFNLVRQ